MTEEQQRPQLTITLQRNEQHQVGDLTLLYVPTEGIVHLMRNGERITSLTIDQAMDLSVILKIWTREYGGGGGKRASKKRKGEKSHMSHRTQAS